MIRTRWPFAVLGALVVGAAPWLIGEGALRFVSEAMLMLAMGQEPYCGFSWSLLPSCSQTRRLR